MVSVLLSLSENLIMINVQDKEFQKEQQKVEVKQQKMMQIHDYRRAAFFGSESEQKVLKSTYKEECDLLMSLKQQKNKEEQKRDKLHTQLCEGIFQRQVKEQRMREIQRREQMKKVAEDNMMIAENKKK